LGVAKPEILPPTILLADDDDATLKILSLVLESDGYRLVLAQDGNEALEILLNQSIDLALLDVNMPGWSGLALCRIMKANPQTRLVPVVLVTGLSSLEDRIDGIQAGADDFLTKPFSNEELRARVRSLIRLKQFTDELENAEALIFTLAKGIEARDPYTGGHCERLAKFSVAIAEHLGLPEEDCVSLRRGGIVHDIGKVSLPDQILLKPGPLTAEERRIMQTHPVLGEQMCAQLKAFRSVLPIIRHHHERMNGSGYPDGLQGEQIPITARILAVSDVFDALTTKRPYREPVLPQEALELMKREVQLGWLDEAIVDIFEPVILARLPGILKAH
jgi:putative two-component system response regulator